MFVYQRVSSILNWDFNYKPSSYWGPSMYGNHHVDVFAAPRLAAFSWPLRPHLTARAMCPPYEEKPAFSSWGMHWYYILNPSSPLYIWYYVSIYIYVYIHIFTISRFIYPSIHIWHRFILSCISTSGSFPIYALRRPSPSQVSWECTQEVAARTRCTTEEAEMSRRKQKMNYSEASTELVPKLGHAKVWTSKPLCT